MNWEFLIFIYLAFGVVLWLLIRAVWFWVIEREFEKQLKKTLNDPADKYYLRGYDAMPNGRRQ